MATTILTDHVPPAPAQRAARSFPAAARRWRAAAVLGVLLLHVIATAAFGQGLPEQPLSPSQMQSGSLLLAMRDGYEVATRINTDVEIRVSGPVARTTVRQEFRNDGAEWVEAVYVFPLPDQAAVDRLRLRIGERYIEGEIREKEQAKKEYEAAKAAGQRAGLVEAQRANLFTTHLANVAPGATIIVEIEYQERVAFDDGAFTLRFPTTLTPRYIPGSPLPDKQGSGWSADTDRVPDASLITPPVVTSSAAHRLTLHATIDIGVPLEHIVSRYHPVRITAEGGARYSVELAGSDVAMDHDVELSWRPVPSKLARASLFAEKIDGLPHYLLMMLPPSDMAAAVPAVPREMILVIDTSGSMHGVSLEQAKKALSFALDDLGASDRFNVIQFNSVTEALYQTSVPATPDNVARARAWVAGLQANGGTEMRPALLRALRQPARETHLRQVVFITDGSVGNEAELFSLIEAELGAARLFTVGIGSAPNGWVMRKAAEAGRGTFTTVSALHEVNEKMHGLFEKLKQPQVTDITVSWPGTDAEAYPSAVPDLYAGEPVVVTARLPVEPRAGDLVRITGRSPGGEWSETLPLAAAAGHPGIGAEWARARIADLLDRERRGGDDERFRAGVVETALAHHLVSKYTSLVAVDKTPVRPAADGLQKEQVPNLLPYGQSTDAIFGFPATATGWQAHFAAGAALVLLGLGACAALRRRTGDAVRAR
ncbi:MAG TPA: marine proteobacterial sortase target protein [Woeseiaceae bacterium]